jgi:hypothetical protein
VFLHDYYILVPEAIAALDAREQLLANLRLLEADLADKQSQLARSEVAASHGGADKRLAQLRQVGEGAAARALAAAGAGRALGARPRGRHLPGLGGLARRCSSRAAALC